MKGKKGSEELTPPPPPPPQLDKLTHGLWDKELKGPMNLDAMNGIIDFNIATPGHNGFARSSSPTSALDSSQSHSDHSFLPPSEFSNPFLSTPVQEKRKGIISSPDYRKISPKTLLPPPTADRSSSISLHSGPEGPAWVPPESWAVEKTYNDPYNSNGNPELSEGHDSGSDENLHNIHVPLTHGRRRTMGYDVPKSRKGKQPSAVEHLVTFKAKQPPSGFPYKMKIYRQDNWYHVVAITLQSTVSELNAELARKLLSADDRVQYNLYLKERGQGMFFEPVSCPWRLVLTLFIQNGCWVSMNRPQLS